MTAPLAAYPQFAGRRLALVEHMLHHPFSLGLQQARQQGLEVWLLIGDKQWYTHGHDWDTHPLSQVDKLLELDTSDPDAVRAALTDDRGKPLVDGVASYSDYHTVVAAQVARRLGLPGPDPAAVEVANVKDQLRVALGDEQFNVRHVLVTARDQLDAAAATLGFPMVAKPPAEAISYGVRRVDGPEQLAAAWRDLSAIRRSLRGQPRSGAVLLEEYVPGVEVSVETITIEGRTHVYGVTSKDLFGEPAYMECGHTFPVSLPDGVRTELDHTVRRTLELIGYRHGVCHTEARHTDRGWRIIEANPRTPANCITMQLADVTGRNPILDGWLLALGERPDVEPVVHRGGAAVRLLYPTRRGVLRRIDGLDAARAIPGVQMLLHVQPGDRLRERDDNSASAGFAYANGPDRLAAQAAADRAAACLDFVVEEQR